MATMAKAGFLLTLYAGRLSRNDHGKLKWSPLLRGAIEALVKKLKSLSPDEEISIDADPARIPTARFIRSSTNEVIAEFSMPLDTDGVGT
jgi:hypothetical protein